jgi:hypothetical protein
MSFEEGRPEYEEKREQKHRGFWKTWKPASEFFPS